MDPRALIEAAARGFAQGLVGGSPSGTPAEATPSPRSTSRRRPVVPRQLDLPLPTPLPDAAGDPLASDAPVPEYTNGEPVGPVVTQAEIDAMERVLRGEAPRDTYNPDGVEEAPWKAG